MRVTDRILSETKVVASVALRGINTAQISSSKQAVVVSSRWIHRTGYGRPVGAKARKEASGRPVRKGTTGEKEARVDVVLTTWVTWGQSELHCKIYCAEGRLIP